MSDVIGHVVVRGRVQGVGYRAFAEHEAMRRKLGGWVRNRRDGTVEAVFSGPDHVVREMIELCRKGPLGSRVDEIEEHAGSPEDLALRGEEEFAVLPSL